MGAVIDGLRLQLMTALAEPSSDLAVQVASLGADLEIVRDGIFEMITNINEDFSRVYDVVEDVRRQHTTALATIPGSFIPPADRRGT